MSSINQNKIRGLLAEVDFRHYLESLGYHDRVSLGGWIARCDARGDLRFAHNAAVFFPETIRPDTSYSPNRRPPDPSLGLHTICSTFHQLGIRSYYCTATIDPQSLLSNPVSWTAVQLGLPTAQTHIAFPDGLTGFTVRQRAYQHLRYSSDTSTIADNIVPEEFSKESLRVAFSNHFYGEVSDIDGIFWGQQNTYPVEIKEKTAAQDAKVGEFFGLDVGPFVKLAYFAAKRGNLHSLFVVKEIDNAQTRNLLQWWFITFDQLAQFASWTFVGGGQSMTGRSSATIRIPKAEFRPLNRETVGEL